MKKTIALIVFTFILGLSGIVDSSVLAQAGCTKVVAKDGSGDFTSIQAGVEALSSGQTLCVRKGVYSEVVTISGRQNLTIKNYPGEAPVIDGQNQLPDPQCRQKMIACVNWCYKNNGAGNPPDKSCGNCKPSGTAPSKLADGTCKPSGGTSAKSGCQYNDLVTISGSKNITFEGFEVKNSTGRLMAVGNSAADTGVVVRNVNLHHAYGSGLGIFRTPDTVIDGVRVWQTKTSYAESCIVGGNGFNINHATGGTVKNSFVYNNYGEGLTSDQSDNITFVNNRIYDNFHVNLHIHGSIGTVIDGNLVFCSINAPYPFQQRNLGILFADEVSATGGNAANAGQNRTAINNVVIGCSDGIGIRTQGLSKLLNDTFSYNTIIAGRAKPGDPANSQNAFNLRVDNGIQNSRFTNNLVIQDGGKLCNGNGCSGSGMLVENNVMVSMAQGKQYIKSPQQVSLSGWPLGQKGSSQGAGMNLTDPTKIAAQHLVPDIDLSDITVLSSSPARSKGNPEVKVKNDFFRSLRPSSGKWDLGAVQFGSVAPPVDPPPTVTPAENWDLDADGDVDVFDFNQFVRKVMNKTESWSKLASFISVFRAF
jgi:hypothetical protein